MMSSVTANCTACCSSAVAEESACSSLTLTLVPSGISICAGQKPSEKVKKRTTRVRMDSASVWETNRASLYTNAATSIGHEKECHVKVKRGQGTIPDKLLMSVTPL